MTLTGRERQILRLHAEGLSDHRYVNTEQPKIAL